MPQGSEPRVSGTGSGNSNSNPGSSGSPDLILTKTHDSNFTQGQIGAIYALSVTNIGTVPTNAAVTVDDSLPSRLTATAIGGPGWTCTLVPLKCTRSDSLAPGGSYPTIGLTVNVAADAPPSVTNIAEVHGGGEVNLVNDLATDFTIVNQVADLAIAKTHSGNFAQGDVNDVYTLTVSNVAFGATSGTVTVTDLLPAGLTAVSMSGLGWNCTLTSLTCTRNDALAGGSSYSGIELRVNVAVDAPASVTNTAQVSGGGELNAGNDTASDVTVINQSPGH